MGGPSLAEMWRYLAAKVVGTSHLKVGQPCQDRFVCRDVSGWFVVAVADGAGSVSHAALGAEAATEAAVDHLCKEIARGNNDYEGAIRDAMCAAKARVIAEAETIGQEARALASTLLVAALGPDGGAAGQIGDGVIAIRPSGDEWTWVFWPQKGQYANQTHFLIEDDAEAVFEISRISADVGEICVMTDGLESLALHFANRTAHSPFFEGIIAPLRKLPDAGEAREISAQLELFLDSPRVRERADDDLTLVAASRLSM